MNKYIKNVSFAIVLLGMVAAAFGVPKVASAAGQVSVWWPTEGASISGTQPFKALLDGYQVDQYEMYWQVDNGRLNRMDSNFTDYPHKEASANVDGWKWNENGNYTLNFVAKDKNGKEIGNKNVRIRVNAPNKPIEVIKKPVETPKSDSRVNPGSSSDQGSSQKNDNERVVANPLSGLRFFVDPNSNAQKQVQIWKDSRPDDSRNIKKIADQPVAKWLGDWNKDIYGDVKNYVESASESGRVPLLVLYNVPERDCGNYSAGGSSNFSAYEKWVGAVASAIGSKKAVVILEPDALSLIDCLSAEQRDQRFSSIGKAVNILKSNRNTVVYIDAGHSNWNSPEVMSKRLNASNIASADGFALNVSNFYKTNELIEFGKKLSALTNNKHFVIDTGRNGLGSNGEWCNPSGRALGERPTTNTDNKLVDAYLWIKTPGESDGYGNGGPSAGTWWPEYALGLAKRAAY